MTSSSIAVSAGRKGQPMSERSHCACRRQSAHSAGHRCFKCTRSLLKEWLADIMFHILSGLNPNCMHIGGGLWHPENPLKTMVQGTRCAPGASYWVTSGRLVDNAREGSTATVST